MEVLNGFIVSLVTTLIFMTAIELIGPDNDMKKYLKFVLGLILVAVILNPVINLFSNGEVYLTKAVDTYTNEMTSEIKEKNENQNNERMRMKEENFKENFNKNCESTLNSRFEDYTFESSVDCNVNFSDMKMEIESLKVYAKAKGVRKIEKIQIGTEKDDELKADIKKFLSDELKVPKDKIIVNYK